MIVHRVDEHGVTALLDDLAALLADTVAGGASVGFLAPLGHDEAVAWWRGRAAAVAAGQLTVWVAREGERVTGTVSLALPDKPNSRHRAELVKLMVSREARGRGLGRRLLTTAEEAAATAAITLLHLDTETGSPAERLYRSAGWTRAGTIPDYAADPGGRLRPTTLYFKRLDGRAGTPGGAADGVLVGTEGGPRGGVGCGPTGGTSYGTGDGPGGGTSHGTGDGPRGGTSHGPVGGTGDGPRAGASQGPAGGRPDGTPDGTPGGAPVDAGDGPAGGRPGDAGAGPPDGMEAGASAVAG
ncbi:acetyltransferase (GNAT) family protein [Streptomyces sp. BK208]|nr:acetyltransferase (GNAT) family protein [Streptomyces sp. BK208]